MYVCIEALKRVIIMVFRNVLHGESVMDDLNKDVKHPADTCRLGDHLMISLL